MLYNNKTFLDISLHTILVSSLGFRCLLGGYTLTLTNTHYMPNGIKRFRVINVFECETKNFNDSYDK